MAAPPAAGSELFSRRIGMGAFRRLRSPGFWAPLLLLALSLGTTLAAGARYMHNFRLGLAPLAADSDFFPPAWAWKHPSALGGGWPFSLTILGILLAHEGGHLLACRKHGIRASWPYVLPSPTLSGTVGAVIRIRSRILSRRALIEVGAAGPIAGYLVSLPTAVVGILLSKPLGSGAVPALIRFHQPLTILLLRAALGMPAGREWAPHPILLASWVGLFVTSLNLVPAGQLDGGHILYAISPQWHRRMTFVVPVLLLAMGVAWWTGWLLWGAILLLPAMRHPRVSPVPELPPTHLWLGVATLVILLLTLLPAPFVGTGLLDLLR